MPRIQDIQDLIDHAASSAVGTHGFSLTATADGIPKANASGTIDDAWLSSKIARLTDSGTIIITDLPPEVVLTENGKIPSGLLPNDITANSFTSAGNLSVSGFKIADGTDIITLMNNATVGSFKGISHSSTNPSQCGSPVSGRIYLSDASLSVPTTGVVQLNRTYNCNCNCDCSG